jgi:hypothetical protein
MSGATTRRTPCQPDALRALGADSAPRRLEIFTISKPPPARRDHSGREADGRFTTRRRTAGRTIRTPAGWRLGGAACPTPHDAAGASSVETTVYHAMPHGSRWIAPASFRRAVNTAAVHATQLAAADTAASKAGRRVAK